jgi:hypothetical protein
MNQGKYVFSQLISLLPKYEFDKCVERYKGNHKVKDLTCWIQFLSMCFGQLTNRDSLRDLVLCLQAHQPKLYHIGIGHRVTRSTLAYANEHRCWRIYADFAQVLTAQAQSLYRGEDELGLCLSVFWWASFRKAKAAIRLHTLLDLRGSIPNFIHISDGKTHEVKVMDLIEFQAGSFYVMDRGYMDFGRLHALEQAGAFFVTRAKCNLSFRRVCSHPVDKSSGLLCDQTVRLTGPKSAKQYPVHLRRVKYRDQELGKTFVFLTNNFDIAALEVALLYKHRWKIELFFKWMKQHLKVKTFWGESENAVKVQIWTAVCTYLLVAIAKKKLGIDRNLYEILQILSVSAFDKTPINQLLANHKLQKPGDDNSNQLNIF